MPRRRTRSADLGPADRATHHGDDRGTRGAPQRGRRADDVDDLVVEIGHRTTETIAIGAPTVASHDLVAERTSKREVDHEQFVDGGVVPSVPGIVIEATDQPLLPMFCHEQMLARGGLTAVWRPSCHDDGVVDVVVLGSGTPNPMPDRAGSGSAIVDGSAWVLVDCGRAVTQRALQAGLDLTALVAVCLTHHHTDHISDLATLATTRWTAGAATPLPVVAPAGPLVRYADLCLGIFDDQSFHGQARDRAGHRPNITVDAFRAGSPSTVVARDGWLITSALVDHHPVEPAVGYRIERAGRLWR